MATAPLANRRSVNEGALHATSPSNPGPMLAVTARPTPEQLQRWWGAMQRDDLRVAYTDAFPATLTRFPPGRHPGREALAPVPRRWPGGGRHVVTRSAATGAMAPWRRAGPGGYFLPAYRGPLASRLWQVVRHHWEAAWIRHIFCAVHVANRLSQVFVTRGMQFHRVGRFPDFALFHGQPTALFIYTLHPEDAALAWDLATARATRQMLSVAL